VPAVYFAVDQLGIGWGQIVRHLAGAGAATSVLLLNDHTFAYPARTRWLHGLAGSTAMVVSVVPWVVDPPAARPAALVGPYPFYYDDTWRSLVHWAAFLVILGWALASCTWREALVSRDITDPHARVGVRLVAAGTAIGLLHVAAHAAAVVVWQVGHGREQVGWEIAADTTTLSASMAVIILGVLWARLRYAAEDVRTRRDVRLLKDHWAHLISVIPEVSPWPQATARPAGTPEQLHWQRSRLATEIHDASRALVALVPETVQDRIAGRIAAAGLHGHQAVAATEHVCLHLAIQARRAGQTVTRTGREPRLYADDSAQAARAIARRLRVVRRRRIKQLIRHVLHEESHASGQSPVRPPARPQPQDALP
jgi:hypothetical protein